MFKANEILINIYHPVNKVKFIKMNPENEHEFVGMDEHGLYSEHWDIRAYVSLTRWEEVVANVLG